MFDDQVMFDDFSDDNISDTPISQVMFEDQIDDFGDDVSCKIESYVKNIVSLWAAGLGMYVYGTLPSRNQQIEKNTRENVTLG